MLFISNFTSSLILYNYSVFHSKNQNFLSPGMASLITVILLQLIIIVISN